MVSVEMALRGAVWCVTLRVCVLTRCQCGLSLVLAHAYLEAFCLTAL